jgi:hypothetical protein
MSLSGNNNELHIVGREVDAIRQVSSVANFALVPYYDPSTSGDQAAPAALVTRVSAPGSARP